MLDILKKLKVNLRHILQLEATQCAVRCWFYMSNENAQLFEIKAISEYMRTCELTLSF